MAYEEIYSEAYQPYPGADSVKPGSQIRFQLPRLEGGKVYLLHKAVIIWEVELMQRINGVTVPLTIYVAPTARSREEDRGEYRVALVNNTAQSFIDNIELTLNDTDVSLNFL